MRPTGNTPQSGLIWYDMFSSSGDQADEVISVCAHLSPKSIFRRGGNERLVRLCKASVRERPDHTDEMEEGDMYAGTKRKFEWAAPESSSFYDQRDTQRFASRGLGMQRRRQFRRNYSREKIRN
jgi:hypothetical protein